MFSSPFLPVEVGDQRAEDLHRIGHRPAPHPAVQRMVEALHLHVHLADPPELVGEGGDAGVEVRGVGEHDEVRGHHALVLLEEAAEVLGADLLLALDEELHVAGHLAHGLEVGRDRGDVGHHPGLVVGGAAAVEPAVALGGLEGRESHFS